MSAEAAALRLRGVRKSYSGTEVLRGIDLDIPAGQVVSVVGSSGSGKTTLLRALNGLETLDSGAIELSGELLGVRLGGGRLHALSGAAARRQRADIGMVFQGFNLFPHLTVLQNIVEAPRRVRRESRAQAVAGAQALLARVGLAGRESAYPSELSGGQQQRVAIARALAMKPRLLLFDEPTSALDSELVGEVLTVIGDVARSGTTMLIVTHELAFAREISDRVLFLDAGRILEDGPPDRVLVDPEHERTRAFIRRYSESLR